jgi:hypothetical protein
MDFVRVVKGVLRSSVFFDVGVGFTPARDLSIQA